MREVTGTTWSFQIIILFILIFACFLTLVLSYSKAYTIKNDTMSMIEKYEGITTESVSIINNYLIQKGYSTMAHCPTSDETDTWYGVSSLTEGVIEPVRNGTDYYYCFKVSDANDQIYYNVTFFYRFNLPVIGEIAVFKVNGRTNSFIGSDAARYE